MKSLNAQNLIVAATILEEQSANLRKLVVNDLVIKTQTVSPKLELAMEGTLNRLNGTKGVMSQAAEMEQMKMRSEAAVNQAIHALFGQCKSLIAMLEAKPDAAGDNGVAD